MKRILVVLLVLVVAVLGCSKEPKGTVVAKVNGKPITLEEIQEMAGPYFFFLSEDQKKELLDQQVSMELVYQMALKNKLGSDPEVKKAMETFHRQILINKMIEKVVSERAQVSEDQVRAYFDEHKDDYRDEVKFSYLRFPTREEAQKALEKLRKGSSFSRMVKKMEKDFPGERRSGTLTVTLGDLGDSPELETTVFSLKPGKISDVVETPFGFQIVKVISRIPKKDEVKFEDVQGEIARKLQMEEQRRVFMAWLDSLKASADIEEYPEKLISTSTGGNQ